MASECDHDYGRQQAQLDFQCSNCTERVLRCCACFEDIVEDWFRQCSLCDRTHCYACWMVDDNSSEAIGPTPPLRRAPIGPVCGPCMRVCGSLPK